jgi:hypothetical protein
VLNEADCAAGLRRLWLEVAVSPRQSDPVGSQLGSRTINSLASLTTLRNLVLTRLFALLAIGRLLVPGCYVGLVTRLSGHAHGSVVR